MRNQSTKNLLFGILMVLFGGFILADPASSLLGFEFICMVLGLIMGLVGYFGPDK
jgi:uncharacterized membrane protein HdeD (DUF308 family)